MPNAFKLTVAPSKSDLAQLNAKLAAFNDADVGGAGKLSIALFEYGPNREIMAGLSGYTAWGWLYVQWLFVEEALRGQGKAGQLLEAAEAEARKRGCHSAHIDTFSPHGRHAYEKAGYEVFGALEDFPKGRTRYFLRKRL